MLKKTILITGINGFLGSNIAKQLKNDYEIVGVEYTTEDLWRLKGESFEVFTSDDLSLVKIFENHSIFAIIHAATVYRKINDSISDILNTNVVLPIKLYELAIKHHVSVFLNTDSFFNDKKYQYSYLSEYTQSKNHALDWLKLLNVNASCKLVNMKIFHMYGPGDALTKFIPQIISKIKSNIPFIDLTEGKQTRDFIYIDDVVSAYQIILEKIKKLNKNEEFEVGTGSEISIKEIILLIKNISNSSTNLQFGVLPLRDGEIMCSRANNLKLRELGWESKFEVESGLRRVIKN